MEIHVGDYLQVNFNEVIFFLMCQFMEHPLNSLCTEPRINNFYYHCCVNLLLNMFVILLFKTILKIIHIHTVYYFVKRRPAWKAVLETEAILPSIKKD